MARPRRLPGAIELPWARRRRLRAERPTVVLGVVAATATLLVAADEVRRVVRRSPQPLPPGEAVSQAVGVAVEGYRVSSVLERRLVNLLGAFSLTFFLVRTSTWVIRQRGRFGPFRNLVVGRRHVHHFVPGIALALLTQALAWIVWIGNPYAALFLVPAAHLWLLAAAPEMRGGRGWRLAFVVLPAVPFALAALAYAVALDANPVQLGWTGLLAIAGGHVSPLSLVVWSFLIGCGLSVLVVALSTEPARPDRKGFVGPGQVRSRGPLTYAGPGSLGGTESARRR